MNLELPDFLNRNPKGNPMNAQTPVAPKAPKRKLHACLDARLLVKIPISLSDQDSVPEATMAIKEIQAQLPKGSTVEVISTGFGKMAAPE
jgi:hypothetical protein